MNPELLSNVNIAERQALPTPGEIRREFPISPQGAEVVAQGRQVLRDILDSKDSRIFLVVGPCSIHDPKAALEYGERLQQLANKVNDRIFLVMRTYFEKPRTTVGWKGLVNDPHMDDSFHIEEGLKLSRRLLLQLTDLGLPLATEALDPIVPQYLSELISWSAIGARTTESQTHRELASGLSMPVGFKNGTDGNIQVAINAMKSSLSPHSFLGVNSEGKISVYKTRGNPYSHIVLRGGAKPNYDAASVLQCQTELRQAGLRDKIMVDCSHGNSNKDHRNQTKVFEAVIEQVAEGNRGIVGMMVESNLFEGNQSIPQDLHQLKYGVSVTDKCIDWPSTEAMVLAAYKRLG